MLLISVTLLGLLSFVYWYKRPNRFPGGPRGLPIVGNLLSIGERNLGEVFMGYQKKYGRIFSVRIGREDWVVLNKFDDIHEALVRQGTIFSGRPKNELFHCLSDGKGLVFIDYGNTWKVQRRFGINTLRRFGIGKRSLEGQVVEEISHLTDEILKKDSKAFNPRPLFAAAFSNVTCNIVLGKRFEYEDETFKALIKNLSDSVSGDDGIYLNVLTLAFWMRHLPYFRAAFNKFQTDIQHEMELFIEIAKQHYKTYDETDLRDFIDVFIKEIKAGTDSSFELEQLSQYIRDLFEAGTDNLSSTLAWCVLCFLNYPEHQTKIHSEIQQVIGSSNPSMKHLPDMPYTAAFIHEIMRHRTMVPTSVFHKTNETVEFKGYVIPKDTTIIPNIWAVHFDPELFKNPHEFNPNRFIDQEGRFVKSPHVIPFGIGPRQCLGMQLAKMEVFIFLAKIVQQFKILPPTDGKIPSFHDGIYGFTYATNVYEAIFKPRC